MLGPAPVPVDGPHPKRAARVAGRDPTTGGVEIQEIHVSRMAADDSRRLASETVHTVEVDLAADTRREELARGIELGKGEPHRFRLADERRRAAVQGPPPEHPVAVLEAIRVVAVLVSEGGRQHGLEVGLHLAPRERKATGMVFQCSFTQ